MLDNVPMCSFYLYCGKLDVYYLNIDYTGCPPKSGRSIFITLVFENIAYFDFIRYNIVFWKEWYQDHLIWLGSIDPTTISWNTFIYEFC